MSLYENYLEHLGLEVENPPDVLEVDLAVYRVKGNLRLPDSTTAEIRFVSFHPDHTDGAIAKLMLESGDVVWTKEIKLV
jgi:hypothetical protein